MGLIPILSHLGLIALGASLIFFLVFFFVYMSCRTVGIKVSISI